MLTSRMKEAVINLTERAKRAKEYLMQYQDCSQNIKALNLIEDSEYKTMCLKVNTDLQREIQAVIVQLPLGQKRTILELHYIGARPLSKIRRDLLIADSTIQKYHKLGLEMVADILKF